MDVLFFPFSQISSEGRTALDFTSNPDTGQIIDGKTAIGIKINTILKLATLWPLRETMGICTLMNRAYQKALELSGYQSQEQLDLFS